MISSDGKGVVMHRQDLRPATPVGVYPDQDVAGPNLSFGYRVPALFPPCRLALLLKPAAPPYRPARQSTPGTLRARRRPW